MTTQKFTQEQIDRIVALAAANRDLREMALERRRERHIGQHIRGFWNSVARRANDVDFMWALFDVAGREDDFDRIEAIGNLPRFSRTYEDLTGIGVVDSPWYEAAAICDMLLSTGIHEAAGRTIPKAAALRNAVNCVERLIGECDRVAAALQNPCSPE